MLFLTALLNVLVDGNFVGIVDCLLLTFSDFTQCGTPDHSAFNENKALLPCFTPNMLSAAAKHFKRVVSCP